MKRFLVFLLTFILIFSFVGCSNDKVQTENPNTELSHEDIVRKYLKEKYDLEIDEFCTAKFINEYDFEKEIASPISSNIFMTSFLVDDYEYYCALDTEFNDTEHCYDNFQLNTIEGLLCSQLSLVFEGNDYNAFFSFNTYTLNTISPEFLPMLHKDVRKAEVYDIFSSEDEKIDVDCVFIVYGAKDIQTINDDYKEFIENFSSLAIINVSDNNALFEEIKPDINEIKSKENIIADYILYGEVYGENVGYHKGKATPVQYTEKEEILIETPKN